MPLIENVRLGRRELGFFTVGSLLAAGLKGSANAQSKRASALNAPGVAVNGQVRPKLIQDRINELKTTSSKNVQKTPGIEIIETFIPKSSAETKDGWIVDVVPVGGSSNVKIFIYSPDSEQKSGIEIDNKDNSKLLAFEATIPVEKLSTFLKSNLVTFQLGGYETKAFPLLHLQGLSHPKQSSTGKKESLFRIGNPVSGDRLGWNPPDELQRVIVEVLPYRMVNDEDALDMDKLKQALGPENFRQLLAPNTKKEDK